MKKTIAFLAILAALYIGFQTFNNYIYQQKQGNSTDIVPYRGTLTGEYLCLPHTDTKGPQTLECALGIKTESGEYYSLDFNSVSQTIPNIEMGTKFSANGLITPVELLSSDSWKKYPIKGIFSVTDSIKKL